MPLLLAVLAVALLSAPQAVARDTPRKPPALRLSSEADAAQAQLSKYCLGRNCVSVPHVASCPPPVTSPLPPCGPVAPSLGVRAGGAVFITTGWPAKTVKVTVGGKLRLLSYRAGSRRWAVRVPRQSGRTVAAITVRYRNRELARWTSDLVISSTSTAATPQW